MSNSSMLLEHPSTMSGCCPSCHQLVSFTLIGVQKWPLQVVAATNLPPQVGLYGCPHCSTSVSETSLVNTQSA
jgi:hypothetical protein